MKLRNGFAGFAGLLVIALGLGSCANMQANMQKATMIKPSGNAAQVLQEIGTFKAFLAAAKASGMMATLEGKGPIAVFAPTDGAFAKLPARMMRALMRPENRKKLRALVANHILAGKLTTTDVLNGRRDVHTMAGITITVDALNPDKGIFYGPAKIIKPDIPATNGTIHVIDKVVLP
jgi:uncharacterized surface protein with fasciclin (FAS1) repeats